MAEVEKPVAAFILSMIGGALILAGGTVVLWWTTVGFASMSAMTRSTTDMTDMAGMMNMMMSMGMMPMMGMMVMMGFGMPMFAILGLVSGTVVLLGAFMLYSRRHEAVLWGAIILAFSLVGLVSMGGFVVSAILGIIGGVLGLTWKSKANSGLQ